MKRFKSKRTIGGKNKPFFKKRKLKEDVDAPAPVKKIKTRREKIEALIENLSIGDKHEWVSIAEENSFVKLSCHVYLNKEPKQFRIEIDSRQKESSAKYRTDIPFDDIKHIYIQDCKCVFATRIPSLFEAGKRTIDQATGVCTRIKMKRSSFYGNLQLFDASFTTSWKEYHNAPWQDETKNSQANIYKIIFKPGSWRAEFSNRLFESDENLKLKQVNEESLVTSTENKSGGSLEKKKKKKRDDATKDKNKIENQGIYNKGINTKHEGDVKNHSTDRSQVSEEGAKSGSLKQELKKDLMNKAKKSDNSKVSNRSNKAAPKGPKK